MMEVIFSDGVIPKENRSEIKSVLQRIVVGNNKQLGEIIYVVKELAGGRSGCDVVECHYSHNKRIVVKIGMFSELQQEHANYKKYIGYNDPPKFFTPINHVTSGLDKNREIKKKREALVYKHAADFDGSNYCSHFEDVARNLIKPGATDLPHAIEALKKLFNGIAKNLYLSRSLGENAKSLVEFWNLRFEPDYVIEVNNFIRKESKLEIKNPPQSAHLFQHEDMITNSLKIDGEIKPDMFIELLDLKASWRGGRLYGENINDESRRCEYYRIEVVTDPGQTKPIQELVKGLKPGSTFHLYGKVKSVRTQLHRQNLLNKLPDKLQATNKLIIGKEAQTLDPFVLLPEVMKRPRNLTSTAHGDLNPRNILVVPDGNDYMSLYLIDYALTNEKEPFFLDFVRLENCLTRDVLPQELTWAQHIRLQRLLSAASRRGRVADKTFATLLRKDHEVLSSAFHLLLAIREQAFEIYCNALGVSGESYREQWFLEYMEQLFLHAHLTFKWQQETKQPDEKSWQAALRANLAIAGVAAEAISGMDLYSQWSEEHLRNEGLEILQFIAEQQTFTSVDLMDLSGMALAIDQLQRRHDYKPEEDKLKVEFEKARAKYVKHSFAGLAWGLKGKFSDDHNHYINLHAFMELKGSVIRPGGMREQHSFEEILTNEKLLAESEQLRSFNGDESVLDIINRYPTLTIIGDAGSGKSTVVSEWIYGLSLSILEVEDSHFPKDMGIKPRLPIQLDAVFIADFLQKDAGKSGDAALICYALKMDDRKVGYKYLYENENTIAHLLSIGALCIIVDALNELAEQKQTIADWITKLSVTYPRTSIIVCHREYNYNPRLLSFPVVTLQKVDLEMATKYIHDYFRQKNPPNAGDLADRLCQLLRNPMHEKVLDLAKTPLFLLIIAECYLENKTLPTARGNLFRDFCHRILNGEYKAGQGKHVSIVYPLEKKVSMLRLFGHKLVQDRSTTLIESEIESIIPDDFQLDWKEMLSEIVATGMLEHSGGGIKFLHQSFQEYFAALYFILYEAIDPALIEERVRRFGWHDTFIVLIGFADESPDVVNQVIEIALKYNPLLTARCLRMAEAPDPELLNRFVQTQKNTLKDPGAGSFAHRQATQALIEYWKGDAMGVLFELAGDADTPNGSRVEILNQLAEMPHQDFFK